MARVSRVVDHGRQGPTRLRERVVLNRRSRVEQVVRIARGHQGGVGAREGRRGVPAARAPAAVLAQSASAARPVAARHEEKLRGGYVAAHWLHRERSRLASQNTACAVAAPVHPISRTCKGSY